MSNLVKSDVEDLSFQKKGVLINTNVEAYEEFVRRRAVLEKKDDELNIINIKINNLQDQLSMILDILQKLKKD